MTLYELSTLTVSGTPKELGRGQGEEFRALIQDFVPMRFEAFEAYAREAGCDRADELLPMGRRCYEIFRTWDPTAF